VRATNHPAHAGRDSGGCVLPIGRIASLVLIAATSACAPRDCYRRPPDMGHLSANAQREINLRCGADINCEVGRTEPLREQAMACVTSNVWDLEDDSQDSAGEIVSAAMHRCEGAVSLYARSNPAIYIMRKCHCEDTDSWMIDLSVSDPSEYKMLDDEQSSSQRDATEDMRAIALDAAISARATKRCPVKSGLFPSI